MRMRMRIATAVLAVSSVSLFAAPRVAVGQESVVTLEMCSGERLTAVLEAATLERRGIDVEATCADPERAVKYVEGYNPRLWNACRPVRLWIDNTDPDLKSVELVPADVLGIGPIGQVADRELRRAGLSVLDPVDLGSPTLDVTVQILPSGTRPAFFVQAVLKAWAVFELGGNTAAWPVLADAWSTYTFGVASQGEIRSYILDTVEDVVERFIDAYLEANRAECRR